MESIEQKALHYAGKGLSVIPVKQNKKPFLKWDYYKSNRASYDKIRRWWNKFGQVNVAIITGAISGVDVVDIDSQKGMDAVNELIPDSLITPIARSQKGGWHYYFQHQEGVGNATRFLPDVDLRGDGGYIIAPPSVGEVGSYEWLPELSILDVAPAPDADASI